MKNKNKQNIKRNKSRINLKMRIFNKNILSNESLSK
jgi:hypothetical protein